MTFASSHHPQAVLIVSDDPTFVGRILERWGAVEDSPALHVVRSENCMACQVEDFQYVLLGGMRAETCAQVLATLQPANIPLIVVGVEGEWLKLAGRNSSKFLALPTLPDWHELLTTMAAEILRRSEAHAGTRRMQRANTTLQCEAALGHYMIDARHNLNNALTSILGNAELLLLDETKLSAGERKQVDTIRVMALRLHEMLQRFSSLEKELKATSEPAMDEEAFALRKQLAGVANQDRTVAEERPHRLAQAAGAD